MKRKIFGLLLLMETAFLLLCSIVSICYQEKDLYPFLITTLLCGITGSALFFPNREKTANINRRDCYVIISTIWVVFSLFGMIPFLLCGTTATITDAFFETMSGFTTTGASILNNIDEQPHAILLWRSIQQWLGGLGIMVFSVALLPFFNQNDKQLFSTEATNVAASKIRPKAKEAARGILLIYALLTLICGFFYWIGPMNIFDAINHAMTTLGTGGYSTHQASIAYYNSPYVEYVCSFFMLIAGVNFALYYFGSIGNWKPFKVNEELKWYLVISATSILIFIGLFLMNPEHAYGEQIPESFAEIVQASVFHVFTIITSAGFQGTFCDYDSWGGAFWMPTILLMVCGACAGSSSGGMKIIRFMICIKNTRNEFILHTHPNAVLPVKISKRQVDYDMISRTLAFFFLFLIVIVCGTMMLSLTGLDFDTAFGSCISAIGNTGPGFGITGPANNFAPISDAAKWIIATLMLIGRLEVYTVLLLFAPDFWRK